LRSFAPNATSLFPVGVVVLLSLAVFLPGLTWGLPSREADPFLFGDRQPWSGAEIEALLGEFEVDGAADVDRTVAGGVVNDTDRERAEIVARYRLYSQQPDEMLTFRALAVAAGNRGDPRFYTYGGLWVYPVGGLIKAGQLAGLIEAGDQAFYLDHPEEFAKFYVVARLYAVAWATAGAVLVCVLVRRLTRSDPWGVAAAGVYVLLPVVVVGAHEAKPHLPGAVLALWAVLPAERYVRTGRGLKRSGLLAGLAAGMVPTMAVAFLVPATAWLIRTLSRSRSKELQTGGYLSVKTLPLIAAIGVGLLAYAMTNPYVVLNALTDPAVLMGNADNTTRHYTLSAGGILSALRLWAEAAGWPIALLAFGLPFAVVRVRRLRRPALLILPSAVVMWVFFVLTADGRPPDHARFAILPAVAATVIAVLAMKARQRILRLGDIRRGSLLALLLLPGMIAGGGYWWKYVSAVRGTPHMLRSATTLEQVDPGELTLWADPAPAFVPPFDLWKFEATVVETDADLTPLDVGWNMSWADRRVRTPGFRLTPRPARKRVPW
jgi:hypothetical protein